MRRPAWAPEGIPLDRPSPARIYDYNLGGYHNFEADRIVAEQLNAAYPDMALNSRVLRAFLRRVVRFLVAQSIDQFLDLGSGIPTVGNVHEVAQGADPAARVIYVDIDPVAVAHSKAILADNPDADAIQADLAEPDDTLGHPVVKDLTNQNGSWDGVASGESQGIDDHGMRVTHPLRGSDRSMAELA